MVVMASKRQQRRSTAMSSALTRALKSVETRPEDAATVALARRYARMIDAGEGDLWRLGPRLLDALIELRMTPKARAAIAKGGDVDGGSGAGGRSELDAIRTRRDQRVHRASSVDSPAS